MDFHHMATGGAHELRVAFVNDEAVRVDGHLEEVTAVDADGNSVAVEHEPACPMAEDPFRVIAIQIVSGYECEGPDGEDEAHLHWDDEFTLHLRSKSAARLCALLTVIFHAHDPEMLSEAISEAMAHGEVRPTNILIDSEGRLLRAEFPEDPDGG